MRHALIVFTILILVGCKRAGAPGSGTPGGMAVQVVAVKAVREPVTETLSVIGTVQADEMVELKAEIDGIVKGIHFEEGQRIEAGALLVELDAAEIEAMFAEAEANQRLAESKYNRARELLQTKSVSQQEADEARAAYDARAANVARMREHLRDTKIVAPFGGIVGARAISPGQVITKQQTLATIVDLDPVKVEGRVPERFLGTAKPGLKIGLTIAAFPGETFTGEVYFVAPQVDPVNRTALVKARVENKDARLKPGMFASADLALRVKDDAIVIPEAALMPLGSRVSVYVVEGDTAQMRSVKTGVRQPGRVEIIEGLKEGELIVVEGWQKVRPAGKVKLAPEEKAAPYLGTQKVQEPTK